MKALVLLLASACAFGQPMKCAKGQHYDAHWWGSCVRDDVGTAPKPLKCGKYKQHTGNVCSKTQGQPLVCGDRCVPIMREVSEKDWQELMERLKKLESERTPPLSDMHCATVEYRPSNNARFDDYIQGHGVELYGCFATKSGAGKE